MLMVPQMLRAQLPRITVHYKLMKGRSAFLEIVLCIEIRIMGVFSFTTSEYCTGFNHSYSLLFGGGRIDYL